MVLVIEISSSLILGVTSLRRSRISLISSLVTFRSCSFSLVDVSLLTSDYPELIYDSDSVGY